MVGETVRRYAHTVRIIDGRLFAFVAFDIGFEIDLEKARTLLHGTRVPALRQARPTPPEVDYPEAPVELSLGEERFPADIVATVTARLFDFGVVSVLFELPLPSELGELGPYGRWLLDQAGLVKLARARVDALVPRVAS